MNHETIEGLIPAYALGAADSDENREVEVHLPSCAACRALLAEYHKVSDGLLFATPPMAAPAGLTERMQRRLATPRQYAAPRPWWTRLGARLVVPAMAAAVLLLVVTNLYSLGRMSRLERQVTEQTAAFAGLTGAPAIPLYAAASEHATQGVVYAPTGGQVALLCVYDMPALAEGKTYQLWLTKDGKRESGGMFQVSQDGYGLLVVRPPRPLTEYDAMGITVEPGGGSPAPTSPRVLGTEL